MPPRGRARPQVARQQIGAIGFQQQAPGRDATHQRLQGLIDDFAAGARCIGVSSCTVGLVLALAWRALRTTLHA